MSPRVFNVIIDKTSQASYIFARNARHGCNAGHIRRSPSYSIIIHRHLHKRDLRDLSKFLETYAAPQQKAGDRDQERVASLEDALSSHTDLPPIEEL